MTIKTMQIGSYTVGDGQRPFIIAEMSGNHNQSLERALAIVDAAADAGADAIKLQTYTADTMTLRGAYKIEGESLWKGYELYDLYKKAYTPWEWHQPLFDRAKERGLIAFSSPFDASAVDFLETLDVPVYKIASFENTDHPLLRKVAQTGKPVIMSTGVATLADIDAAVRVLKEAGCQDLILLKCTSSYPASPENSNLRTIPHMRHTYDCPVGLSDHTMGVGAPLAAIGLGACVIEKHFTLDRSEGGVDSQFSLEPAELQTLCTEAERAYLAIGEVQYGIQDIEAKNSRQFKRSIYISKPVAAGEVLSLDNLQVIRPGFGLEPQYLELVIGKKAPVDMAAGTPLTWELLLGAG